MLGDLAWFAAGFICCLWLVTIFSALQLGKEADQRVEEMRDKTTDTK